MSNENLQIENIKKVQLTELKPYWRNPNMGDVPMVKSSIKLYGYVEPIIVDKQNVIIAGHTRYKALQELALEDSKYNEVVVVVSGLEEHDAKAYRIVDNQTAKAGQVIMDKLIAELRELDYDTMLNFYPQEELDRLVKQTAGAVEYTPVNTDDVQEQKTRLDNQMTNMDQRRHTLAKTVICPNCEHEFEVE